MSVASEIQRIQGAKADLKTAIQAKGVSVPSSALIDDYPDYVDAIQQGSTPSLQSKTATPSTSQQTITPDSGYDGLSQVTISAINTETATVTPTTSQQQITPSIPSHYLTKVTVDAVTSSIDANITAGNIKSGTTILGVTGNYAGASATVATTTKAVGTSNVSSLAFTVSGQPKMFAVQLSLSSSGSYLQNTSTSTYYVSSVIGDGVGNGANVYTTAYRYNSSGTRAAREYYYTTGSASYSNGTLTVSSGTGSFAANQTYRLIYVY